MSLEVLSIGSLPPCYPHIDPIQSDAPFTERFLIESHENEHPPPGSPTGPLWREREMPVYKAFLYVSFKAPSKGALSPGYPNIDPIQSDAPFTERFLIESQENEPPPPGSPTGPLWRERDVCLQSLPLRILQGPQ